MDKIRIPRRALQLKFKGKRLMGRPKTGGFWHVPENKKIADKKLNRK
jgi:hypothetical protein